MRKHLLLILTMVVGTFFGIAGMASANQRFLPSGIDSVSPSKAKSEVLDYAELNDDYARLLASQTGASDFNRADYRSRGFSKAKANTFNTSLTGSGGIAESKGAVGTKTLVLVNIRTGKTVQIMVRCANIRTKKGGTKCNCSKPVAVHKVNRILVNKKFTKIVTRTCPSGQSITITINGRVRGWVRGTLTGKVVGSAKLYLSQQVNLQVTAQISIKCGTAPVAPPTAGPSASVDCKANEVKNSQGICVAVAVECKAGEVKNAAGNCVVQSNTAEQNCKAIGGTFNGATQLCTIIMINANCSNVTVVNGSGNVVSTSQEGNCNSSPPPTCPTGTTGTCPNCQTPPTTKSIKIVSMTDLNDIPTGKTSTNYFVEVSASDEGGSLTIDPGIGSISDCNGGMKQGSMTLPVPKGIKKFCFTIWAPNDPAKPTMMSVTATAVLGGLVDPKVDHLLITYPTRPS